MAKISLSYGSLISRTFKDYFSKFKYIFTIAFIFLLLGNLISFSLSPNKIKPEDKFQYVTENFRYGNTLNPSITPMLIFQGRFMDKNIELAILEFFAEIFSTIIFIFGIISIIYALKEGNKKMRKGIFQLIGESSRFYLRGLGIFLIYYVVGNLYMIFVLFIIFVFFGIPLASALTATSLQNLGLFIAVFLLISFLLYIPLIYLAVRYYLFAHYSLVNEDLGVIESFIRSGEIVKGRWWRVFFYSLITGLITIFVAIVIFFIILILILIPLKFASLASPVLYIIFASVIFSLVEAIFIPFPIAFLQNFYLALRENR